jgi:hypothetical protein
MKLFTVGAIRAAARFGVECRDVPCETTACRVGGEYQFAEEQDLPFQVTSGSRKAQRPEAKIGATTAAFTGSSRRRWGSRGRSGSKRYP